MGCPASTVAAGHGSYFPAATSGLIDVEEDVIGASPPSVPCGTIPTKRVTKVALGMVPARASARSSTPLPQVNAAGSMAPVAGVHAVPPGTRASAPAAHERPTEPLAIDALRAADTHIGLSWPFASRK
jgi:hypothetical protein